MNSIVDGNNSSFLPIYKRSKMSMLQEMFLLLFGEFVYVNLVYHYSCVR